MKRILVKKIPVKKIRLRNKRKLREYMKKYYLAHKK